MKKNYLKLTFAFLALGAQEYLQAQCATTATLGTATNMFTLIRNGNHPIVIDKSLNMAVFIHRNDAALLGGSSGELRYDYSTNAGSTWTVNQGVLNPLNSSLARYPNVAIYSATNNTNPSNAYVSYMAPTINPLNSAWNGVVTGVRQVSGGAPTETYNQNGIGFDQIPHSLVKGAPGVFWAIDPVNIIATGYKIYRGVWNNSTNDIVWTQNLLVNPPFTSGWTSASQVVDYNIAFDPTGLTGYFSFLGHVTGNAPNNAVYPILYKTVDGGVTWTGPIQVDLSGLSCISSNTVSGAFASCNVEHDLIVDALGNPHIISTVGSATNYIFNYSAWHHMYDITMRNGMWVAHDLGNVNGAAYTAGVSPNFATNWQAPQAARSADGTKIFFTWTDNSSYSLGTANSLPDLYGKAFNVSNQMWTQTKNFTACNSALAGRIFYPHLATEVFEPNSTTWKLAGVFGIPAVTNDLGQTANFYFLDNLTFSSAEFSVAVPPATVSIAQAPSLIFCPGSTVNINVPNAGDVLWSNSATVNPLPVTSGTLSALTVTAVVGCRIGTASINIVNLNVNAGTSTPSVCPGALATFTASGNALSYTWSPGSYTGTTASFVPTSSVITLSAGGSGCSVNSTVGITILQQPTISIAGNGSVCAGYSYSRTASGAQSYLWSDGSTGATYTGVATTNTTIGVAGTAANTCTNFATMAIIVTPTPAVNASSSSPSVCMGQSVALFGTGTAATYSWNGVVGANTVVTPAATTVYTLQGTNSFSCMSTKMLTITVEALPTLSVSATRTAMCKNEKNVLTASGAISYTWLPQGLFSASVQIVPTQAQTYTYTVQMLSAEGCTSSGTYQMVVSACTGMDPNASNGFFEFYPNPNSGSFTILSDRDEVLLLINETGQHVMDINLNPENARQVEISGLPAGIYFISAGGRSGKILVNK